MKVIAGLGNPGSEYANTPHNVGFRAVDSLCAAYDGRWKAEAKHKAECARISTASGPVLLVKPQTFMNLSGEALRSLLGFYKIPVKDLVVLSDDINLAPGRIRIRPTGGSGGHNGLRSIIDCLGTNAFLRVRIGVGMGHHPVADLAARVLGKIEPEDEAAVEAGIQLAAKAALCAAERGPDYAMNLYNGPEALASATATSTPAKS